MKKIALLFTVSLSLLSVIAADLIAPDQINPIQHQLIKGTNLIYTANQIDELLKNIVVTNIAVTNISNTNITYNNTYNTYTNIEQYTYTTNITYNTYTNISITNITYNISSSIKTNRYPLFCIELNTDVQNYTIITNKDGLVSSIMVNDDDPYSMSTWNAFELKASTNNFLRKTQNSTLIITNSVGDKYKTINYTVPALPENLRLIYWGCSEFSMTRPLTESEPMRKFVPASKGDPRTWEFFDSISELDNQYPNRIMVLLDPASFTRQSDNSWCHDHNEDLVWSYVRKNNSLTEKDDSGNSVWRPIQPVKWYSQLPAWAYTNNEVRVISKEEFLKFKNETND